MDEDDGRVVDLQFDSLAISFSKVNYRLDRVREPSEASLRAVIMSSKVVTLVSIRV